MFYKQLKFKRQKDETFNNRRWGTDDGGKAEYLVLGLDGEGLK